MYVEMASEPKPCELLNASTKTGGLCLWLLAVAALMFPIILGGSAYAFWFLFVAKLATVAFMGFGCLSKNAFDLLYV